MYIKKKKKEKLLRDVAKVCWGYKIRMTYTFFSQVKSHTLKICICMYLYLYIVIFL